MMHLHIQPSELINLDEDDYVRYNNIMNYMLIKQQEAYDKDFGKGKGKGKK